MGKTFPRFCSISSAALRETNSRSNFDASMPRHPANNSDPETKKSGRNQAT
jgi:hypothetical protein